jgi:Tat protein translocase TatB subunit
MFDIGFQELIVIFIVVLLVFGPKRLPELARTMGKAVGELKKAFSGVQDEISKEMKMAEMEQYLPKLEEINRAHEAGPEVPGMPQAENPEAPAPQTPPPAPETK